MSLLLKFILAFFILSISAVLIPNFTNFDLRHFNYWDTHGVFFLVFISLFPRLTLIVSSAPFGGLFWWLGFFFAPRLLVAVLATINYWHQNPLLVTISWLVAITGESSEKTVLYKRGRSSQKSAPLKYSDDQTIEADFTRK